MGLISQNYLCLTKNATRSIRNNEHAQMDMDAESCSSQFMFRILFCVGVTRHANIRIHRFEDSNVLLFIRMDEINMAPLILYAFVYIAFSVQCEPWYRLLPIHGTRLRCE